jgi:hypothetical protein
MASTTVTPDRDELVAEWIARESLVIVQNRLALLIEDEDKDIAARMPGSDNDVLVSDERCDELHNTLWPDDDDLTGDPSLHPLGPDAWRASAESCYIAARLLRTLVYHADGLRDEAERLFELSREQQRKAAAPEGVTA